jgi:hypothetical protein
VSDTTASRARLLKLLAIAAGFDLLVGIVLAAVGVVADVQGLTIGGVVLLLSGAGMLGYVSWQRNKPTVL